MRDFPRHVCVWLVSSCFPSMLSVIEYTSYVCLRDPLVAASVILTQWRTRLRRQMNDRDVVRFYLLLPSHSLIPVH